MTEENLKRLDESLHKLYEELVDKPLQIFNIFNDFFGEDKVDIQDIISEEDFKSWIKEKKSVNFYISNNWGEYADYSIMELPQDRFDEALSLVSNRKKIIELVNLTYKPIFILVHFPHVRVTNENDRYVDINNLWVKVKITYFGTILGKFTLNRSEYPAIQYLSNYLHSHILNIPKEDFTKFQTPCTGDGPINSTICSLTKEFDVDLWQLFCLELSKFVTVESIKGVPYRYLERIGTESMNIGMNSFVVVNYFRYYDNYKNVRGELKDFIRYFIQGNHLKFNYKNNSYSIGMSFIEYIVLISNEYIKWYNEQFNNGNINTSFKYLKSENIIQECIISNGKIYYNTNNRNNFTYLYDNIGKKVCDFKGKVITLNITGISELNNNNNISIILNPQIALFILNQIIKVLNYRYGRNKAICSKLQTGTEVRYL